MFPYILISYAPTLIFILIIIGVVAHFSNRNKNTMEPNQTQTTAKDFFLNIGAIVALYTVVGTLLNLLFTVIDHAYPPINSYNYYSSTSISWPVSILIVAFPVLLILYWVLGKDFESNPEKRNLGIHKWLSYLTAFIAAAVLIGDLITVIYTFLNGEELTTGFLLKVFVVLAVSLSLFLYYLSDLRGTLETPSRRMWRIISTVLVIASIIWGFSVIGSPMSQRQIKYDEQKISDLQNMDNQIRNYYGMKGFLPNSLSDLSNGNMYYTLPKDPQSGKSYEYTKPGTTSYGLCADFNKDSKSANSLNARYPYPDSNVWSHPAGHYCFSLSAEQNNSGFPNKPLVPMGY